MCRDPLCPCRSRKPPDRPERAFVFHVEAWDVNCPQHITARFTQAEMEPAIRKLERRNAVLQERVNELEAVIARKQEVRS